MDKNMDMNGFCSFPPPYYGGYEANFDPNMGDGNAMFNPMVQYEQAYMYYRYMTQQVEYKIKCKEYDKFILMHLFLELEKLSSLNSLVK